MKKLIVLPFIIISILVTSCEDFDWDFGLNLVPDIDTSFDHSYNFIIDSTINSGFFYSDTLDLNTFDDYTKYRDQISAYAITKVSCFVENYNATEGLYFSGSVLANTVDSSSTVTVAEFNSVDLYQVVNDTVETELNSLQESLDAMAVWMEEDGVFIYHLVYQFENEDGTPYTFTSEDHGDSFELKLRFGLFLETKL